MNPPRRVQPHPAAALPRPAFPFGRRAALGLLLAAAVGGPAAAQEVRWRYDYNAARREAQEKALPLLLEFATEQCFWCRKLEDNTLRDPAVLAVMNERFIPLKIDAQRSPYLVEVLHIQSFPTVVLAAPDGKIVGTLEGFMEPTRFQDHLQRALVSLSNPEWMVRDYQEAARAVTASDYARAVALLTSILQDDRGRPVQVKAHQLLNEVEQQAAGRLARAKHLEDRGQFTDAADTLTELLRNYAGTQAAKEGGQMLTVLSAKPEIKAQQRASRARELLAQAKEDYRTQQYVCCMDRCELLASGYGDLPEGAEAVQILSEIKANPEWMRQACDSLSDRLGLLYLSLAETWLKKGQPQQAVVCLERVIQAFPGSRQAETAQVRLAQLQGQPTRRADFKNP
jgi:thioredoxin-like negative regulator of GroEL